MHINMGKTTIKNRYGIAPNNLLNDESISLKAKGLFVFIQSKPDGWKFSIERIAKQNKDGEKSIRAGIRELEKYGYLQRNPIKIGNKWDGYEYILDDAPAKMSSAQNARTQNARTQKGNTLSKKEYSKKDIVKKNIDLQTEVCGNVVNKLLEPFYKLNPTFNYGNKTQRKAIEVLVEKIGEEKTRRAIEYAVSVQGENKFAPVITTPLQLKNKFAELMVYWKKQNGNGGGVIKI